MLESCVHGCAEKVENLIIWDTEGNILRIADKVQSGFARTAKLFAMDDYEIMADLMRYRISLKNKVLLNAPMT